MSGPVPNTEVEAAAIGRRFNGNDKDLMKYGAPTQTWHCIVVGAGAKCGVYKCVDGWILVAYCNGSGGCTEFYEVPCPDQGHT